MFLHTVVKGYALLPCSQKAAQDWARKPQSRRSAAKPASQVFLKGSTLLPCIQKSAQGIKKETVLPFLFYSLG